MIDTTALLAAGAVLPDTAVDALALYDAATYTDDTDPAAALLADVKAGAVTPADLDKRVADAAVARLTAQEADDVYKQVRTVAGRRHDAVLRADAEALIAAMRPEFDRAVAVFAEAATLGITQHTDSTEAIRKGGHTAATYAALTDADRMLTTIRSAVYDLTGIPADDTPRVARFITGDSIKNGRIVRADFGHGVYAWTDLDDADQLYSNPAGGGLHPRPTPAPGAGWLALIHAGHTLHLNSNADTAALPAKAARIERDTNARHAKPEPASPAAMDTARRELAILEQQTPRTKQRAS